MENIKAETRHKIIFWKFNLPPMVYASKNVFPCPGSKACKHPSIKIDVIVKDKNWLKFIKNPDKYLKRKIKKIQKNKFFGKNKYNFSIQLSGSKEIKLLKKLGQCDKRQHFSRKLSGGMQRRLMVARALIHKPKLLILDEPTAGADVEVRRLMWDYLKQLNDNGTTIILTTHYLEEAENLCKNIAIIDDGKILENSSMKDFLSQLKNEKFIFYTDNKIENDLYLKDKGFSIIDDTSLEVSLSSDSDINTLINELSNHGIKVKSLKNKTNRLEELFMRLVDKNGK